jgi:hypothetical protein
MALLVPPTLGGCWSPIDLSDRRCPCDDGWRCVADRCVEGGLTEDAGTIDAPRPDAGAPSCPLGTFCEDFESTAPLSNGWSAFPDLARAALVDSRDPDPRVTAHRGTGMLRVSTDTPGGAAELEICPFTGFVCPSDVPDAGEIPDGGVPSGPGLTAGDVYMRAYVYAPTNLADGRPFEMGHASVMHVGAHRGPFVAGEDVVGFNLDVDRVAMYVGTSVEVGRIDPRPAVGDMDDRPAFPRDTWVCIRTHVHIDAVAGTVATYMGSDEVPEVYREGIDTLPSLPFVHFGVGLGYTSEMPNGAVLYIDDVAVGRAPIACLE